jgi:anhydro-N-acetylmuramic acid kinase
MPIEYCREPSGGGGQRSTVGISVSSDCARLSAVLVTARGDGLQLQVDVGDGLIVQIPKEATSLWRLLADAGSVVGRMPTSCRSGEPGPEDDRQETLTAIGSLRSRLADVAASAVRALLAETGVAAEGILAIGIHDPGLWSCTNAFREGYLGLSDPARLAEATGINVIDAFPARDLAAGGQGGPVTTLAEWILVGHPRRSRVLVDLGRTTRLSYLGAETTQHGPPRLYSFEVGPGMHLVDLLAQRLTNGEQTFDPGGRLAVQGQRLAGLLDHWLADPYFRRSIPRWHPRGVRPERFLFDALNMAVEAGWAVRDLLCTATHFVAESIAQAVARDLPDDAPTEELVVTGGGQQNGMLLRELTRLFSKVPLVRTADLGIDSEALAPACAAALALLHIDQVAGNPPEVTGSEAARVLGSLTPGSPQSWKRLLSAIHGSRPMIRPLRSAV